MQLLQGREGGGGLLVGDGAKMDDLKNTGSRRKAQGEQGVRVQPSRRTDSTRAAIKAGIWTTQKIHFLSRNMRY